MVKALRGVLAMVLGVLAAFVVIMIVEMAGHRVFPPPPGFDPHDPASLAAAMRAMPTGALVAVLAAWAAGVFAGGWVAARVAPGGKLAFGLAVGALFLLAALAHLTMIPHPAWMWAVGLAELLPAAYLGARLATPRRGRAVGGV